MKRNIVSYRAGSRERHLPWQIGKTLREKRAERRLSTLAVSKKTKVVDPSKKGVAKTRIEALERDTVEPSLRDLHLICAALGIQTREVIGPDPEPWFVVRSVRLEKDLKAVAAGKKTFHRSHGTHEYMIEEKQVYRYVPIEDDEKYVAEDEREGMMSPCMRASIFEVGYTTDSEVANGLDAHSGEEVIYVLDGSLEFFFRQVADQKMHSLVLKPHDSIHYSSRLEHGYRSAIKSKTARAIFVFADPRLAVRLTSAQFVPESQTKP